jgi:hypothetical protein
VVLEVTATSDQGKKIFETAKIYMPQSTNSLDRSMVYGPTEKVAIIRDTSIQPFRPKEESFAIKVPGDIGKVNVEVTLTYQPRPGDIYPIHKVKREILIESY